VLRLQDDGSGTPVRWDPCRPIHYVIRPDGAPDGSRAIVVAAFEELGRITGYRFVDDGATEEAPRTDRPAVQPQTYGDGWAPVLVAWTDDSEFPSLTGYVGLGGAVAVGGAEPGRQRYVTGIVLLGRSDLADLISPTGRAVARAVILHELGHLVGLGHVSDAAQAMAPRPAVLAQGYGDGDRRGLAVESGGACTRGP
jgi:hypothetical protein